MYEQSIQTYLVQAAKRRPSRRAAAAARDRERERARARLPGMVPQATIEKDYELI